MIELLRTGDPTGVVPWTDSDTQELWEANRLTQDISWPYHNKRLTYTINSQGFRGAEFDQVDWNNSLLFFGCSFTFGVGVDDTETMPLLLGQHLSMPVINLGVPGASSMHMWALTTQLADLGVRPRACVYVWPGPNRVALFRGNNRIGCWGPWTTEESRNLGPWTHPHHGEEYCKLAKASVTQMWRDIPVSHWTWNKYTYKSCGKFTGPLLEQTDYARDLIHPGTVSLGSWASTIARVHL